MEELTTKKERDRLEVINSILFTLNSLERSIHGWRSWIRNLSIMSKFSIDELKEIDEALHKQAKNIIKYDLEATKKWKDKFPKIRIPRRIKRETDETRMYV
jgi:hypothetical protein